MLLHTFHVNIKFCSGLYFSQVVFCKALIRSHVGQHKHLDQQVSVSNDVEIRFLNHVSISTPCDNRLGYSVSKAFKQCIGIGVSMDIIWFLDEYRGICGIKQKPWSYTMFTRLSLPPVIRASFDFFSRWTGAEYNCRARKERTFWMSHANLYHFFFLCHVHPRNTWNKLCLFNI